MKRITENPHTTLLGILVLVVLTALVWLGKATLTEASGFFTIAIGLIFSKDTLFLQNFAPWMREQQAQQQQQDGPGLPGHDDNDSTHKLN